MPSSTALAVSPLIIPALGESIDQAALLDSVDGLLFTGSPSNVEPRHYSGPASEPGTLHDSDRDATTLPLVRAAIDAGIPVLGICRGFQEMNVAFGGSLHQKVHEVGTFMDHREPADQPLEVQYAPRHAMHVQPGGVLAGIGLPSEFQVNSIHGQGVDRLAPGLRVEALAPDGLVAISVEGKPSLKRTRRFFSSRLSVRPALTAAEGGATLSPAVGAGLSTLRSL